MEAKQQGEDQAGLPGSGDELPQSRGVFGAGALPPAGLGTLGEGAPGGQDGSGDQEGLLAALRVA